MVVKSWIPSLLVTLSLAGCSAPTSSTVTVAPSPSTKLSAPPVKPKTVADYLSATTIVRPRWSPDGKTLTYLKLDGGDRKAFLWSAEEGERVLAGSAQEMVRFVTWGPGKGELTLGLESPRNRNQQLYTTTVAGGPLKPLVVEPEAFHEIGSFSADGARATISSNARKADCYDVYLWDLENGAGKSVYQGQGRCLGLKFSGPEKLLLSEDTSRTSNVLHLLDLGTNERITLGKLQERAFYSEPVIQGDSIVVITDRDSDQPYLGRIDIASDEISKLLRLPAPIEDFAVERESGRIVLVLNVEGQHQLFGYDGHGGKVERLAGLEGGFIRHLRFLGKKRFSFLYSRHDMPPSVLVWKVGDAAPEIALHGERGDLTSNGMTRPERVYYDSGRMKIPAWLYRSHQKEKGKALVFLDHDPGERAVLRYNPSVQLFVDHGYTVLVPDVRGSGGRGRVFEGLDDGARRSQAVDDVVAGAAYLKGQSCEQISVFGREYGGYLAAAALLDSPGSFREAVVIDPVLDLESLIDEAFAWQKKEWREELGSPSLLRSLSPRKGLKKLTKPLLILYRAEERARYQKIPGNPAFLRVEPVKGLREALEKTLDALQDTP